ncbi:hypothetical protein ACQ86N_47170 [Puia sp. P3]|uniref:hypothetical protein n=1 Tax=Puia sp. P3 TaxID=3423952 RepID=UPI003D678BBC
MADQSIDPGRQSSLSISLRTSASLLGDVVVIGYGTQKEEISTAPSPRSARETSPTSPNPASTRCSRARSPA